MRILTGVHPSTLVRRLFTVPSSRLAAWGRWRIPSRRIESRPEDGDINEAGYTNSAHFWIEQFLRPTA